MTMPPLLLPLHASPFHVCLTACTDHSRIVTLQPAQVDVAALGFDIAISASSFDHDGLGRCRACAMPLCLSVSPCSLFLLSSALLYCPTPFFFSFQLPCVLFLMQRTRYGDPLDPEGDLKAMRTAKCMLREGGLLLVSVPVGTDLIVYNLHRRYDAPNRVVHETMTSHAV